MFLLTEELSLVPHQVLGTLGGLVEYRISHELLHDCLISPPSSPSLDEVAHSALSPK